MTIIYCVQYNALGTMFTVYCFQCIVECNEYSAVREYWVLLWNQYSTVPWLAAPAATHCTGSRTVWSFCPGASHIQGQTPKRPKASDGFQELITASMVLFIYGDGLGGREVYREWQGVAVMWARVTASTG